ncbi:hypothetical protein J0H58_16650 [bacterium]|nr:hypothetical protein [bacterium]
MRVLNWYAELTSTVQGRIKVLSAVLSLTIGVFALGLGLLIFEPVKPAVQKPGDAAPLVEQKTLPQDVENTAKTAGKLAETAVDFGDTVKESATELAREMELSRYVIRLTPAQEKEFLRLLEELHKGHAAFIVQVKKPLVNERLGRFGYLTEVMEQRIAEGNGLGKPAREAFAVAEGYAKYEGNSNYEYLGQLRYDTTSSPFTQHRSAMLASMARGEDVTARDVMRAIHLAGATVKRVRKCEEVEKAYNRLLTMMFKWSAQASRDFYGLEDPSLEACLAHRLNVSAQVTADLYLTADRLYRGFLSNSPDRSIAFEFPELTPAERAAVAAKSGQR